MMIIGPMKEGREGKRVERNQVNNHQYIHFMFELCNNACLLLLTTIEKDILNMRENAIQISIMTANENVMRIPY